MLLLISFFVRLGKRHDIVDKADNKDEFASSEGRLAPTDIGEVHALQGGMCAPIIG